MSQLPLDDDDEPVGRVLTRREAVRLLGVTGAAMLAACRGGGARAGTTMDSAAGSVVAATGASVPACVVRPEMTVGPYFLDRQLDRSDIRTEPGTGAAKAGAPLLLTFNITRVSGGACTLLPGAMVDVWQCDAEGAYSGFDDDRAGFHTVGQKFLRGYQRTDASGAARFTTIYPGWYQGRTVHIHFKVRAPLAEQPERMYEFTSQLFFDDALSDRVLAQAPYAAKGERTTRNANDGIYRRSGGDQLLLAAAPSATGYTAAIDIGLDLSDAEVGKADAMGGPGGRRPPV